MIDEKKVVRLYVHRKWSLRRIADHLQTDHHRIKRILKRKNIPITTDDRVARPIPVETRRKMSETRKGRVPWNKGVKYDEATRRRFLAIRVKQRLDSDRFPDYERLKFLIHLVSNKRTRFGYDDVTHEAFVNRFYFDPAFNAIFTLWEASGWNKWHRPTVDHIIPTSKGGDFSISNLQFLTWFENRAKAEMTMSEWEAFKKTTNTSSDLFLERILT
jgi:hypothetical protein